MIENLEDRKLRMKQYLEEEYENKKVTSWWWRNPDRYVPTREIADQEAFECTAPDTIIRRNFKSALGGALFILIFAILIISVSQKDGTASEVFFPLIFCCILPLFFVVPMFNQKPILIINLNGIWTDERKELIPWEHLLKSYIKECDTDESTMYSVVFHYYHQPGDQFLETDISIGNLDGNFRTLANAIESWKLAAARQANPKLNNQ